MDAAKHDHLGIGASGPAGQLLRITNEIGHILDGLVLVVMGKDHSAALLAQLVDACQLIAGALGWGEAGEHARVAWAG
jgi:hypothetical protein